MIKMKDMINYKDYCGSVHYSDEDKVFYGKVEFIKDLISYEGTDVNSLNAAFKESVNDYLKMCDENKKDPDKPFKGSFNVRVGVNLHRQIAIYAKKRSLNTNQVVIEALNTYLGG